MFHVSVSRRFVALLVLGWMLPGLAPTSLFADQPPTPVRRSIARIDPLDASRTFDFGRDFAVDGSLLVAGAPSLRGDYSGSVYVLELLPGWSVEEQMVWLQEARLYDGFDARGRLPNPGAIVSLDSGVLAVAYGYEVDLWQRDELGQWVLTDKHTVIGSIVDVALRGDELLIVQPEVEEKAALLGAAGVLEKPYDAERIREVMEKAIGGGA